MLSRTVHPVFPRRRLASLLLAAALGTACRPTESTKVATDSTAAGADSQFTPAAMIAAFRAKIPGHPTQLGAGAATDRGALVAGYARALERGDTTALRAMQLDVAEFAWLYYVDSPMAQQPYELDPDVMWMQISSQSTRGLTRALARFGGHALGAPAPTCEAPKAAGALRLHACTLTLRAPDTRTDVTIPLSIVERDGRFKFVGYGNGL
jgi:hypothetical protein